MKAQWKFFELWAPLKTVLFRDGGVSRVLTSSCIRPYTPVFRAQLPCPHKKCRVFYRCPYLEVLNPSRLTPTRSASPKTFLKMPTIS